MEGDTTNFIFKQIAECYHHCAGMVVMTRNADDEGRRNCSVFENHSKQLIV
jgi:hypothetical protein